MFSFEFSPVKLVYGGDALGFHDGHTVFAPRILPGERALVEQVRTQKSAVFARPLQIIEPSPDRIEPGCPHFGRCGGCQYQHFSAEKQLVSKTEILRETLRRLGQITWDGPIAAHAGPPWNYRNQAQLKVAQSSDGAPALGFFEMESNRLVAVDACPILSPRLNSVLGILRHEPWISQLTDLTEIEIFADDRDEKVMLTLNGSCSGTDTETFANSLLSGIEGVSSVAFAVNESLKVYGEGSIRYEVGDYAYQVGPGAFFQSSRFLLPEFVNRVTTNVAGAVAMDLYAGVGLFSLPLSAAFDQVTAVEVAPHATESLAVNAKSIPGRKIRAVTPSAFDYLRRSAQMGPDLVVLDPPRAGVEGETLKLLIGLHPKRVHYVSCSPPTLARDLSLMLKRGYKIESIDLFDFFPQTYHIESLVRLSYIGR